MENVSIITELIIGYFALYITVKLIGKTQISQITPFDFISALVLGELLSGAIYDEKVGILKILLAIFVWGGLIYITVMATQKYRKVRHLFEGRPSILISQGKLNWLEMKKNKIDLDQLNQLLRSKDIFSVQEVQYAIFENNGSISVLRKAEYDYPSREDLEIKVEGKALPLTVISDGEVLIGNLKEAGLNKDWLQNELKSKGIDNAKEVFYAEWQSGKPLYYQKY